MRWFVIMIFIFFVITGLYSGNRNLQKYPFVENQLSRIYSDPSQVRQSLILLDAFMQGAGAEADKGMKWILQDQLFSTLPDEKRRNYALEILVNLLAGVKAQPGETMVLALAIANSTIYANSGNDVRRAILDDIMDQYRFYQELTDWQKKESLPLNLERAPLFAQLCWADRTYNWQTHTRWIGNCKSLDDYRNDVIRVETLRRLHNLFVISIKASTLEEWAAALEDGADTNFDYLEQECGSLNGQMERLEAGKKFQGHCGSYTSVQLGLYAAAGIPALGVQMTYKDLSLNHAYPYYYDALHNKWKPCQTLSFLKKGSEKVVMFQIGLPNTHPWVPVQWEKAPNYWFDTRFKGDYITESKLIGLNSYGIKNDLMEKIYLMKPVRVKGIFAN